MSLLAPAAQAASAGGGADLLQRIVAVKQEEVGRLRQAGFRGVRSGDGYRRLRFESALRRPPGAPLRVIAECKKASPSMGRLRDQYDVAAIAREYAHCGANALSVLTDGQFFEGALSDLQTAISAAPLPALRKDFIISAEQIEEARAAGASAVLLIVRILSPAQLGELLHASAHAGLAVLVEVHNEAEAETAAHSGATIIGINHRDLDSLQMDMSLTARLAPQLRRARPDAILIGESGVEDPEGLAAVTPYADAVLIGTAFMRSRSIAGVWARLFA